MLEFPETFNLAVHHLDKRIEEGKGDRIAIRYGEASYTYEEVYQMVNRLGNALLSLGLAMEQKVDFTHEFSAS